MAYVGAGLVFSQNNRLFSIIVRKVALNEEIDFRKVVNYKKKVTFLYMPTP